MPSAMMLRQCVRRFSSAIARYARHPAPHRPPVLLIARAKTPTKSWFLVGDHEQMKKDCHDGRIDKQPWRPVQPRLAQDNHDRTDVNRIAYPSVRTGGHNSGRRIPQARRAVANSCEVPDAEHIEDSSSGNGRRGFPMER